MLKLSADEEAYPKKLILEQFELFLAFENSLPLDSLPLSLGIPPDQIHTPPPEGHAHRKK